MKWIAKNGWWIAFMFAMVYMSQWSNAAAVAFVAIAALSAFGAFLLHDQLKRDPVKHTPPSKTAMAWIVPYHLGIAAAAIYIGGWVALGGFLHVVELGVIFVICEDTKCCDI